MDTDAIGLALAFASALSVNWGYTLEHDAAATLPPVSPRRPVQAIRTLVGSRAWLRGFAFETGGWLVYVAALRLAPLALVQGVGAAGIGILALAAARGPARLAARERVAALTGLVGLGLLAGSLVGHPPLDHRPSVVTAVGWLAGCALGALALVASRTRLSRAAVLGLAAGLLFAGGDVSVKLLVQGGWWAFAFVSLVVFYGVGSIRLQAAFQAGDAVHAAGMATLTTNAVPIAAGFVVFGEALPGGALTWLQVLGLGATVAGASLLARR
jgi:hypothetical protein